jgi:GGDEF domain-containing protein
MDARPDHDDPRKLRDMLQKASKLAAHYDLTSVMIGASGEAGDRLFSEMVDYIGSALRVDDAICRLTRERAVFLLADADQDRAAAILERLMNGFRANFTPARDPHVDLTFFEVTPDKADLTVRDVLPSLFDAAPVAH